MRNIKILFRFALVVCFALPAVSVYAKSNKGAYTVKGIADFFITMPDNEIPYLSSGLKSDMVDYYRDGKGIKVKNLFDGESWISHLDSARMDVVLSQDRSLLAIQEYETCRGKRVYGVVKTLFTPIPDSRIAFYDSELNIIATDDIIELPEFRDYFQKPKEKLVKKIADDVDLLFVKIEIDEVGNLLFSLDNVWTEPFDDNIKLQLKQNLHSQPLKYKWDGSEFDGPML